MSRTGLVISTIAFGAILAVVAIFPATDTVSAERQLYDETADARADLAAAKTKAEATGKHVLIQWGANWCGWCHRLNDQFTRNDEVRKVIEKNYIVVRVDLGHRDKNMALARDEYGLDFTELKIPHTSVRDAEWNVIAEQQPKNFGDPNDDIDGYVPAKVLAFLVEHAPQKSVARGSALFGLQNSTSRDIFDDAADGDALIAAASEIARAENKRILIAWGANWCGWCHKLENHLTNNNKIRDLISQNYVVVHINLTDHPINKALAARDYGMTFPGSKIPHVSVADAYGNSIVERQPEYFGDPNDDIADFLPEKILAFLDEYKPPTRVASVPRDIYDEQADARDLLGAARKEAAETGKHVLITWGANWCGWCHKLERHFARNAEIRKVIEDNYIKVHVDLGQRDKHMLLARDEYGLDFNDLYIAHVTILDANGKSLAERQPGKLIDKQINDRDFSAALILDLLEQYKPQ